MNFCPNCYGELTGNPGPRFKGYCPKCKQNVLMKAEPTGLTAKMNVFLGLDLSKQIAQLQRTTDELLAETKKLVKEEYDRKSDERNGGVRACPNCGPKGHGPDRGLDGRLAP